MESKTTLVCDVGTGFMKFGWAGDNFPESVFPSLVGRPMLRFEEQLENIQLKPLMVGEEAAKLRALLELSHPIDNGVVKDWEMMSKLFEHGFFEKMNLDLKTIEGKQLLLSESPKNLKTNRSKLAEVMFEKFQIGALRICLQPLLAMFSEGMLDGIVVDCGEGVTNMIPVCVGYINNALIKRLNVAGRNVTNYLTKLLLIRGYAFNSTADFETVREIKEKLCYVSNDLNLDRKLAKDTTFLDTEYVLPDNSVISIGRERFEAPECLFDPGRVESEMPGVSEMIIQTIDGSPIDNRKELYKNILLSGGSTLFPGFPTRIQTDIENRFLSEIKSGKRDKTMKHKVVVMDPPRRKNAVFLGASVCAKLMKDRPEFWITKEQYYEQGMKELIFNDVIS